MKKNLVKRWWIDLPCYFCASLIVQSLLRAAGTGDFALSGGFSFAKFAVWACCFYVVERVIRFALWGVVLVVAPQRMGDIPWDL